MFCCLRHCLNRDLRAPVSSRKIHDPDIQLDTTHMGHEVVIVKSGRRLCGSGGALATAPLIQSKSYFEAKIQQNGEWSIGIATRDTDINKTKGGMDKESWCICSDNKIRHNEEELYTICINNTMEQIHIDKNINSEDQQQLQQHNQQLNKSIINLGEGDTIGVAYDHVELNFYLNGKNLEVPVLNVKGTVYPALYVDDGAIIDIILDNFNFPPPQGFEKIMLEQSLL